MSSMLIQALLHKGHASKVDDVSLDNFLKQHRHSLLFFAGNVNRYPESNDLAVILPELLKAFDKQFQIGLVSETVEKTWQQRFGFTHWPSLVLLRGEHYLGVISQLQDWVNYCAEIQRLLQSDPVSLPGTTLPVL